MPELNELFEQAKGQVDLNDEAAKNAAMEALKKSWGGFYQAITNLGFGAAQAKFTKEVTDANTRATAAEQKLTDAETKHQQQLRDLQDKAPDVKTVNEQWETKVADERERHRREKETLKNRIRNVLLERDQQVLQAELEELHVPKAIAKIKARDPELLPARGEYADDGSLSVRQAGLQISLGPGSGRDHLKLLANEVILQPEIKEILETNGDRGSGVDGGSQPGRGDAAFYENLRRGVKESSTEGHPTKSLRERVQGR